MEQRGARLVLACDGTGSGAVSVSEKRGEMCITDQYMYDNKVSWLL